MKKKRILWQILCSIQNILELLCLVDNLDEMDTGLRNEKKNILNYIMVILFFLKLHSQV